MEETDTEITHQEMCDVECVTWKNKEQSQNRDGELHQPGVSELSVNRVPSGEGHSKWTECLHRSLSENIKEDIRVPSAMTPTPQPDQHSALHFFSRKFLLVITMLYT